MRVFYGFDALPSFRHPAVTVGSFDGVHRGHRALLCRLTEEARAQEGESIVLTFDPHPRQTIGNQEVHLLTTLDERIRLIAETGVDALIVIPFDQAFASLSAEEFTKRYLIGAIGAETLIAGYDHRFGHDRREAATLAEYSLKVVRIEACDWEGVRVSSTAIRTLLDTGRRAEAEQLAGHPMAEEPRPSGKK